MTSPCHNCQQRKLICHDKCDEYMEYHDALLAAKTALRVADKALGLLKDDRSKLKRRWERRHQ